MGCWPRAWGLPTFVNVICRGRGSARERTHAEVHHNAHRAQFIGNTPLLHTGSPHKKGSTQRFPLGSMSVSTPLHYEYYTTVLYYCECLYTVMVARSAAPHCSSLATTSAHILIPLGFFFFAFLAACIQLAVCPTRSLVPNPSHQPTHSFPHAVIHAFSAEGSTPPGYTGGTVSHSQFSICVGWFHWHARSAALPPLPPLPGTVPP